MVKIEDIVLDKDTYIIKSSQIKNGEKGIFSNKKIKEHSKIGLAFKQKKQGELINNFEKTVLGFIVKNSKNSNVYIKQEKNDFYFYAKFNIDKNQELLLDFKSYPWFKQN